MRSERSELKFPVEYEEKNGKRGWYAEQTDTFTGMKRKSAERYPSREDLVTVMAFGKHQWGLWYEP